MTRDAVCAAVVAARFITIDPDAGRVFRWRGPGGVRLSRAMEMPGTMMPSGYLVVSVMLNGIRKQARKHRLVWIAANGVPPAGMVVAHKNNVKTDCRLANLELLTSAQNSTAAAADGLYRPVWKLDPSDHDLIRDAVRAGASQAAVSRAFGISKSRVGQIVTRTPTHRSRTGTSAG